MSAEDTRDPDELFEDPPENEEEREMNIAKWISNDDRQIMAREEPGHPSALPGCLRDPDRQEWIFPADRDGDNYAKALDPDYPFIREMRLCVDINHTTLYPTNRL